VSSEDHLSDVNDLNEAARRAGYIVTEQIDAILEKAQHEADTIRRDAERDAEDIRHEAVTAATRLLSRLQALEFPLGQLVADLRDETDRVNKELEGGAHVDSDATQLPAGDAVGDTSATATDEEAGGREAEGGDERSDAGPEVPAAAETAPDEPVADEPTHTEAEHSADAAAPDEKPPATGNPFDEDFAPQSEAATWEATEPSPTTNFPEKDEAAEPEGGGKGTLLGRRKKRLEGLFVTAEGRCAICQRGLKAGSESELARSGWRVSGDVGLCPDCQADRWQLPDGARIPFRRGAG
jgi:hypothetical protein